MEKPKQWTINFTNLDQLPPEFRADFEDDPDFDKKLTDLLNAGTAFLILDGKCYNMKGEQIYPRTLIK